MQVELDANVADLQERLQGAPADIPALCKLLLELEAIYCHAGEGLPKGEIAMLCLLWKLTCCWAGEALEVCCPVCTGRTACCAARLGSGCSYSPAQLSS